MIFDNLLHPDIYVPTVTTLVRTTTNTTVTNSVVVRTSVYVGGELQTEEDGEPADEVADEVEVVADTTDDVPAWGRFAEEFTDRPIEDPQTAEEDPVVTVGTIESGNYTTTTRLVTPTTMTGSISVERRVILKFDTSDYFRFGDFDSEGEPLPVSASVQILPAEYVPSEIQSTDFAVSGTMRGFFADAGTIDTAESFDTLWDEFDNTITFDDEDPRLNVNQWAKDIQFAPAEDLTILLFTDSQDAGGQGSQVRMAIADRDYDPTNNAQSDSVGDNRFSLVDQPYDWHRDWVRTADGIYVTKNPFPSQDYHIDLRQLLPGGWFDAASRTLRIELFSESSGEGDAAETTQFEATFSVTVADDPLPQTQEEIDNEDPLKYEWTLSSTGTLGTIIHQVKEFVGDEYVEADEETETTQVPQMDPLTLTLIVRDEVIEFMGGSRTTGDIEEIYSRVPYYIADPPLPAMKLRIDMNGDRPQAGSVKWNGVQHVAESRNNACPNQDTCPVITPYHHQEWRVLEISFPGFTFDESDQTITHSGCGVTIDVGEFTPLANIQGRIADWQYTYSGRYVPSVREVYNFDTTTTTERIERISPPGETFVRDNTWFQEFLPFSPGWATSNVRRFYVPNPPWTDPTSGILLNAAQNRTLHFIVTAGFGNISDTSSQVDAKIVAFVEGRATILADVLESQTERGYTSEVLTTDTSLENDAASVSVSVSEEYQWLPSLTLPLPETSAKTIEGRVGLQIEAGLGVGLGMFSEETPSGRVWTAVVQLREPVLDAELTEEERDTLSPYLSETYWYSFQGQYYGVAADGESIGPLDASGFNAPEDNALVSIMVDVFYHSGFSVFDDPSTPPGTVDALEICREIQATTFDGSVLFQSPDDEFPDYIDVPPFEGDPVRFIESQTPQRYENFAVVDAPYRVIDPNRFPAPGAKDFGQDSFVVTSRVERLPATGYETAVGQLIDRSTENTVQRVWQSAYRLTGEWDYRFNWVANPDVYSGTQELVSFAVPSMRICRLRWNVVVPRWIGRSAPTITVSGSDVDFDDPLGLIGPEVLRKLEDVSMTSEDIPLSTGGFDTRWIMCQTHVNVSASEFSMTIGPKEVAADE